MQACLSYGLQFDCKDTTFSCHLQIFPHLIAQKTAKRLLFSSPIFEMLGLC